MKKDYIKEIKQNKEIIHLINEQLATNTHFKVGKTVRNAIKEIGGDMPEDLPTPKKSLKELEKERKNKLK